MQRFLFAVVLFASLTTFAVTQTIHIGNGAEPKDLDPNIITGMYEYQIVQQLFEPILDVHPVSGEPLPGVAEKWSHSKDRMVWTFNLRKDAKWSNGDPVTADDFVYSWTRVLDPATASEYAYFAYFIKNGEAYNTKKITDPKQLGIRAVDKHTFELTLQQPVPFVLKLLSFFTLSPVHKATVEKFGRSWTKAGNMVSNGAYILAKWDVNKEVVLKKNPNYWDKAKVTIEEAHYYPTEKADTEEKLFRSKKLHVTNTIPIEKVGFWHKDTSGALKTEPLLSNAHMKINTKRPPLNDKRVRKALSLGLDRTRLTTLVLKGGEDPAYAMSPPGAGGYQPKKLIPVDKSGVAEAKKLLAEAGFADPKKFPKVDILYNTAEANKKFVEAIQQMWKENLGIDVGIVNQEWKVYLDSQRTGDFFIARARWVGDYDDPDTFLNLWVSNGGNNNTNYANPDYDGLVNAASKEYSEKKRAEIFDKAEAILADDVPIIPVYIEKKQFLLSPSVEGWPISRLGSHPLKYVKLK